MSRLFLTTCCTVLLLMPSACNRSEPAASTAPSQPPARLVARAYNSGFDLAHDSFNGISCASNGKIYYVLSSESVDVGAQMYSYDPVTDKIQHLGDLTEACGEKGLKAIAQ